VVAAVLVLVLAFVLPFVLALVLVAVGVVAVVDLIPEAKVLCATMVLDDPFGDTEVA
jgi:hypothetical protein